MKTDMKTAEAEVIAVVHDLYHAFVADDQARFDSHLSPDLTVWESHFNSLYGRQQLDEFRMRRAEAGQRPVLEVMKAEIVGVDVWGDTALVRYLLLTARSVTDTPETTRVTEVMRRTGDSWLIVHRHAQAVEESEEVFV